jgi:PDZ domain
MEVKSDPFRVLGIHGAFTVTIPGKTHMNIGAVNPGSPAAKNGLRADDEIVAIEGKPVGLGTLFSFRKMVMDADGHGLTFDCTIRPYRSQATRLILFQSMREPRHRWLPLAQSTAGYPGARDPMPQASKDSIPDNEWRDKGNATPQVALVSLFCAFSHGDVERVCALLDISANDLEELSALFHSLPDAGRKYYGSPERMLAAFVDQEARPRWIRIRKASSSDSDRTSLQVTLRFWNDLDHSRVESTYSFHRTTAGWKWAISSDSVRRFADYYHGVPFELAPPEGVPEIAWFFRSR